MKHVANLLEELLTFYQLSWSVVKNLRPVGENVEQDLATVALLEALEALTVVAGNFAFRKTVLIALDVVQVVLSALSVVFLERLVDVEEAILHRL